MKRWSANINLIPDEQTPGKYELWVSMSRWEDGRCIESIPVFNKTIVDFPEAADSFHGKFAFLLESSDLAYGEISVRYADLCKHIDEVNARPANTSTN